MDLWEAYASITYETRRLLDLAKSWPTTEASPASHQHHLNKERAYQPKQPESLAVRLGEAGVAQLIQEFLVGVTQQELAASYECSLSTVQRLLRNREVRR